MNNLRFASKSSIMQRSLIYKPPRHTTFSSGPKFNGPKKRGQLFCGQRNQKYPFRVTSDLLFFVIKSGTIKTVISAQFKLCLSDSMEVN